MDVMCGLNQMSGCVGCSRLYTLYTLKRKSLATY